MQQILETLTSFLVFSWYVFTCVVVYRLGRFVLNVLRALYVYYVAPMLGLGVDFRKYHKQWTVITGCTDGIGYAYAFALAEKGLRKFVLISRSPQKLKNTSDQLTEKFPDCQVQIFPFTFGQDDYAKLKKFVAELDVGILVNNVGDAPPMMSRFGDDYSVDKRVTAVNIEPAFELIQAVLPNMKNARQGIIVNVSSSQSIRPVPGLASYSSSKVYLAYLSECLSYEYSPDGIIVQCLVPLLVATKLAQYSPEKDSGGLERLLVPRPNTFARQAVNSIGTVQYSTGCFNHEMQRACLYLLPFWILRHVVAPIYRLQQARAMAMQKKEHS
jgi:17beta-estradiol 17-dehydrogenase / very-long-chain 3-oxoacyl-CoA reductase